MSKTCFISQINKTLFIQTENNYWYCTTYIDVTKLFCLLEHKNHSFFIYLSIQKSSSKPVYGYCFSPRISTMNCSLVMKPFVLPDLSIFLLYSPG